LSGYADKKIIETGLSQQIHGKASSRVHMLSSTIIVRKDYHGTVRNPIAQPLAVVGEEPITRSKCEYNH